MRRALTASLSLMLAASPLASARAAEPARVAVQADPSRERELRERVEELEARLALIDRRLRLLAAESEAELLADDEGVRRPALLLQEARAVLAEGDRELAYHHLSLIRSLHPESPESAEAFPLAAALFQWFYDRNRQTDRDSAWVTTEPIFVFEWLGSFYGNEAPPTDQARSVFLGMPWSLFTRFLDHAAKRAAFSAWVLEAEEDNGLIERVTVRAPEAAR